MRNATPISEFMSPNPIFLAPTDTMDVAEKLFFKYNIHHLPVVEDGQLLGVVHFSDYLKIVREIFGGHDEILKNKRITESLIALGVMQKEVITLRTSDTLGDAVSLFKTNQFNSIPIVKGNQLVGILTATDMLDILETLLFEQVNVDPTFEREMDTFIHL